MAGKRFLPGFLRCDLHTARLTVYNCAAIATVNLKPLSSPVKLSPAPPPQRLAAWLRSLPVADTACQWTRARGLSGLAAFTSVLFSGLSYVVASVSASLLFTTE